MTISSNESRWEDAGAGFARETPNTAESKLSESAQFSLSSGAEQTFKLENERKEQSATKLLPDLQLSDFGKDRASSTQMSFIKADGPLERPGYQPNDKAKFDERDYVGSKTMPAEKSPTATITFVDGSKVTIPMPPAKPGQFVNLYMPRQPEGGRVITATAGDKAWILRKDPLGRSTWEELTK